MPKQVRHDDRKKIVSTAISAYAEISYFPAFPPSGDRGGQSIAMQNNTKIFF